MDISRDFDGVQKAVSAALVSTTRTVARISSEDISFLRSSSPIASQAVDQKSARLLHLAEKLLIRSTSSRVTSQPRLPDVNAVDTNWRQVVDGVDSLLERADITLDEFAGYFRKRNDESREQSPVPKRTKFLPREFRNQNIAKPQLLFEHKPFNDATQPFKPLILTKPHAKVPLAVVLNAPSKDGYPHPYQDEIEVYQFPSFAQITSPPIDPKPFETTKATFVDDMNGVRAMLATLKQADLIAIDLEHHDTHSYIGMVSLMQISTRDHDWIVDTLKPWRQELQILNEVFADPGVVKVLHGAQMDCIWLQRDLGLYLVGLFDTYHAARALGYAGHGLAFLLKKFCDFDAQKQYQTADWRMRPLPTELFDYARSDTHFLLYIYDNMRNELIDRSNAHHDKLQDVLISSKEYALQRYEHPLYCDQAKKSMNGWFNVLCKSPTNFTDLQLAVFRKIHQWRDRVARAEDESPNQVLPNHALHNIARATPGDSVSLLRVIGTASHIARLRLDELLDEITNTQADPRLAEDVRLAIDKVHKRHSEHSFFAEPVLTQDTISMPLITPVAEPARMETSSFWGSLLSPDRLTEGSSFSDLFGLTLSRSQGQSELPVESQDSADFETDRRKRKRRQTTADSILVRTESDRQGEVAATTDNIAGREDAVLRVTLQAERIATKERANLAGSANAEVEAYDYEGAPSVLHSSQQGQRREKKSQKGAFNPYAKASEAASGLGRAQNFRTGRTTTFK